MNIQTSNKRYWRWSKPLLTTMALSALISMFSTNAHAKKLSFEQKCADLNLYTMTIPAGEDVDSVTLIGAEVRDVGMASEHCAVLFEVDVDDSQEWVMTAIHFLPKDFNGRYMQTGGGGSWSGFSGAADTQLMELGFAQGQMNNENLEFGVRWIDYNVNDEADALFSRDGLHLSTVFGKQLQKELYGKKAKRSYYMGCSTGGNQGQQAALYHPKTFDGISIGAPAFYAQAFYSGNEIYRDAVNAGSVLAGFTTIVRDEVLAQCDHLDGHVDGVIDSPKLCDPDLDEVAMNIGLTPDETMWLKQSVSDQVLSTNTSQGPVDLLIKGRPIEISEPASARAVSFFAFNFWAAMDQSFSPLDNGDFAAWEAAFYPFDFSSQDYIDQIGEWAISVYGGEYLTDLTAFDKAGGKLILWHTWPDFILGMDQTVDWFEAMKAADGKSDDHIKKYLRFFQKTTGGHCDADGDVLREALVRWVERGKIPSSLPLDRRYDSNRPACEYPKEPRLVNEAKDKWKCVSVDDDSSS